jgi:glucose/arabinose dehydrogenase
MLRTLKIVVGLALLLLFQTLSFAPIDVTWAKNHPAIRKGQIPISTRQLRTMRVASGLSKPLFVTSPPADSSRLFIVEQNSGQIKILSGGMVLPTAFLDIGDLITSSGNEQGLLGLAFHPDYSSNGYFFVNYTDTLGNTTVARYKLSGDPNQAEPDSQLVILNITQPFANHNGGMLVFGPGDGYLYIGTGDGGAGGDPGNRAQDDGELLGKMLRIDVDGGSPYGIPPDNPFVGAVDSLDEIWAKGFRNPWRFSFDRVTHDLYIADVGESAWEEVDFQVSSSTGGENYGWRLMEGDHCYNPPTNCDPGGLTDPIHEYSHGGDPNRCAIVGGFVYRGEAIPDLQGTYFFADDCSGQIWSFRYDGDNLTEFTDRTAELDPGSGMSIDQISSFGEDAAGELYIVDLDGEVYKITYVQGLHLVSIVDFDFVPQVDTIAVGDSVRWTNNGTSSHTTTSDTKSLWDSGTLSPGESFTFQFDTPGSYPYHCEFHPSMTGTIVVQSGSGVKDETGDRERPSEFVLSQNYPNPFNPATKIEFTLAEPGFVTLKIYDLGGRVVRTLVSQQLSPGYKSVIWDGKNQDGRDVASGVYFCRLKVGDFSQSKKMLLLK